MVTHSCISSHYTHGMYVATTFVVFFAKCGIWRLVINQSEISLFILCSTVQVLCSYNFPLSVHGCWFVANSSVRCKKISAKCRNYSEFPNRSCFSHCYILVFMLYTIIISRFIMHRPMYWLHVHFSLPSSTWLLWTSCAWLLI